MECQRVILSTGFRSLCVGVRGVCVVRVGGGGCVGVGACGMPTLVP